MNRPLNRLELGMHQMHKDYDVNALKQHFSRDRSDLHHLIVCWQLSMQCVFL